MSVSSPLCLISNNQLLLNFIILFGFVPASELMHRTMSLLTVPHLKPSSDSQFHSDYSQNLYGALQVCKQFSLFH